MINYPSFIAFLKMLSEINKRLSSKAEIEAEKNTPGRISENAVFREFNSQKQSK